MKKLLFTGVVVGLLAGTTLAYAQTSKSPLPLSLYIILNNVLLGNYIIINQDFHTPSRLYANSGIRSIEIISPVFGTYNEPIQNQDLNGNAIEGQSQTSPILVDFHFEITSGADLKGNLIYNPTAQYRYMSFKKNGPITNISFTIQWRDNVGNVYPIYIPFGETAQMKFLFELI